MPAVRKKNFLPATHAEVMFEFKALVILAGGSVQASGTGSAGAGSGVYSGVADVVTTAALFNNTDAWARLWLPGATARELTIQHGAADADQFRVKYKQGNFTNIVGDADTTPGGGATEQLVLGAGTDAAPTYAGLFGGQAAGTYRGQMWAKADGPAPDFFAGFAPNAGGDPIMLFYLDVATVPAGVTDPDPAVLHIESGTSSAIDYLTATANGPRGWLAHGEAGAGYVRCPVARLVVGGTEVFPRGCAINPHDEKYEFAKVDYMRPSNQANPTGRKGQSGYLYLIGNTLSTWSTVDLDGGLKNGLVVGDLCANVWDGTDPWQ